MNEKIYFVHVPACKLPFLIRKNVLNSLHTSPVLRFFEEKRQVVVRSLRSSSTSSAPFPFFHFPLSSDIDTWTFQCFQIRTHSRNHFFILCLLNQIVAFRYIDR